MSGVPDHVAKTIDGLKNQVGSKLREVLDTLSMINGLEEMYGAARTSLAELSETVLAQDGVKFGDSVAVSPSRISSAGTAIRPDEYLGKPPLEAAKLYIRRVGHAVNIDEIAEAISRGGAATGQKDWKEKLLVSLIRSTLDAVKVQDRTFGLREFYTEDQLKGLMSDRRPQAATGRQGKKASQKKRPAKPKKSERESDTTTTRPTSIHDTTVKFLQLLVSAGQKGISTREVAAGLGYGSGRSLPFLLRGMNKVLITARVDPNTTYEGRRIENEQRWFAREKIEAALKLMKV